MDADAITQLVTLLLVGLGIVWHQQRSTDKLRDEFQTAIRNLRDEFQTATRELRRDHDTLRDAIAGIAQRLARIEGFLRIGTPSPPNESTQTEPE
ncbi:MAG: hypothetical protein OXB92_14175, partial [Acidimicrobiaceae bacterium]|nr:hypothetical protein [Acidimicrobiia bacterium]MCY4494996.1 hypothetical protein [Acidimicrobiaceae bacterium]